MSSFRIQMASSFSAPIPYWSEPSHCPHSEVVSAGHPSIVRTASNRTFAIIKPGDVPNINLYMDQVTTFMYEHLHDTKRTTDDKVLTKTMINNYAKNNLLPSPVKKKYSKEHIYILTFIYYFKNILSISDIQKMLNPLTEKFFDEGSKPDLDYIYKEIFSMESSLARPLSKDIFAKSEQASNAFSDVKNDDDREFLQFFSLVCLLSFDVYMKKNMIESLIDDYSAKHAPKHPEKSDKTDRKK